MTPSFSTPGRWRRFACMMYESILLFGVIFTTSYLFDTLTQSRSGLDLRHGRQVVLFLALGVYFVLCWRRLGQTLPMKTCHIRLVDEQGRIPALRTLLLRYILIWPLPLLGALLVKQISAYTGYASTDLFIVFTPFLNFIWTWFDKDQQFLHDRLSKTRLIDARPARAAVPAA
ncbi:RDD family protein [Alcaligenes sp. Marseille-Q7550]